LSGLGGVYNLAWLPANVGEAHLDSARDPRPEPRAEAPDCMGRYSTSLVNPLPNQRQTGPPAWRRKFFPLCARSPQARLPALGAPPLTGAAVGALLRGTGTAASAAVGIGEDFISEVGRLIRPGTSALFVLDQEGDMDVILQGIQGLGGTVLKTNVDLERAKLIQSTLTAASADTTERGGT
jgi:hypothetical protein